MNLYSVDYLLLLLCSTLFYYVTQNNEYAPIFVLSVINLLCINSIIQKDKVTYGLYLFYLILCACFPNFLLFLPVMIYSLIDTPYHMTIFACIFPLLSNFSFLSYAEFLFILLISLFSVTLKKKTFKIGQLQKELSQLKLGIAEFTLLQEEKNRTILENQDYEITTATLTERNRISKEIHDNIGHLLSRSLLQIGALLTISKEEVVKQELTILKDSISEGMDSIRASIHNMHEESIDLYYTVDKLMKEFQFCHITWEYDIFSQPLLKMKYCFIATIKEALNNISKHSNATLVHIILKEQPALYQLIIWDNGTISDSTKLLLKKLEENHSEYTDGMGLQNIYERVRGFHGNLLITGDDGFKIFITIPKE